VSTQIASEQTTALLDQTDGVTTQRLESRGTGRNRSALPAHAAHSTSAKSVGRRRPILIGVLVVAVIGVICAAALLGMRSHSSASSVLIYPGAKTVVDMTMDGGRAVHLTTSDPFSAVEAWYQKELKPQKTMRLTSTSVVLKNDKTTATIVTENNLTNILIKVSN
jgi:hypothetical protein